MWQRLFHKTPSIFNDTRDSKFELGSLCYDTGRYAEAEQVLRQAAWEKGTILGTDKAFKIPIKLLLGKTLLKQHKYAEGEELLQNLIVQKGNMSNEEICATGYMLGVFLYHRQKFTEAEQLFRQSTADYELLHGTYHESTLYSMFWQGATLCVQQKFAESVQVLSDLIEQLEQSFGEYHEDTIACREFLRMVKAEEELDTFEKQFTEASTQEFLDSSGLDPSHVTSSEEVSRKVVLAKAPDGPNDVVARREFPQQALLGKVPATTTEASAGTKFFRKGVLATAPNTSKSALEDTVHSQLSDFFADNSQRQIYTDSEIQRISTLLSQINVQWSKVPRTYIVLRTIGCLDVLDTFVDLGFSDHWFPLTERRLPPSLHPSKRSQFVAAQDLVMTKSVDLEKGEKGRHCHFRKDEPLPLEMKEVIGTGGFSQVDRVRSLISFKEYARKRVLRSNAFAEKRTEWVKLFIAEIQILKRIKHHHVVEFIGSYTDPKYMGLIMSPIADMDLNTYLTRADTNRPELRTFFGCLARALEFLHEQNIRHKDIKPSNILIHGGNVLYTDFGLALDFTDKDGSTTVSMVNGMTSKYCAPEVADHEPRNTSSDIWSLGVVFLEMAAVLKGRAVPTLYGFLAEHGTQQAYVRTNHSGTSAFITELKATGSPVDNRALGWVQDMIMLQQQLRPTAASLIKSIVSEGRNGDGNEAFCGICCTSHDESASDFDDEMDMLDTN